MSTNRRQKPTFLVCKHCGQATTETENAQNGSLKAVSPKSGTLHEDTIKDALKRLNMYPPKKERKKNGENRQI
jgi:hypothetical protein